jgi:hypothetical protein
MLRNYENPLLTTSGSAEPNKERRQTPSYNDFSILDIVALGYARKIYQTESDGEVVGWYWVVNARGPFRTEFGQHKSSGVVGRIDS